MIQGNSRKKRARVYQISRKDIYANNTGGDKYVAYDVAGNVTNKTT